MKKQNISRLLMGAATITLATMVANGEAKASEETPTQSPVQQTQQTPVQQTQRAQATFDSQHVSDAQRAFYHTLHINGITDSQHQGYIKQLRQNPNHETTAQNVFSESTKDSNNPDRRLAQRNAYFEIIHNPKLSSQERERYIGQLIENPDHSQQIWIESNRVPSGNSGNTASEADFLNFTQSKPLQLNQHTPKYQQKHHLPSQNQYNTATEAEFEKFVYPNHKIKLEHQQKHHEYLTNLNRDNTLVDEDLHKIIDTFKPIPVSQTAKAETPSVKLAPLFPYKDLSNEEIFSHLRHLRDTKQISNVDLESLLKWFPPIGVNQNKTVQLSTLFPDNNLSGERLLNDLRELYKVNRISKANLEKLLSYFPPIPVKNETSATNGQTQSATSAVKTSTAHVAQAPKVTPSVQSEKASTSYYQSVKNFFSESYNKIANTFNGYKTKYENTKYYVSTYFKYKNTIDKFVLTTLGDDASSHIRPLKVRPNDNVAYNALLHARNFFTEGINTGKVLHAFYKHPTTVKNVIATADTASALKNIASAFVSNWWK